MGDARPQSWCLEVPVVEANQPSFRVQFGVLAEHAYEPFSIKS
jgi:hypothetical protein